MKNLDTDKGECNNDKDDEEFTTSQEFLDEHSTSDIPTEEEEESEAIEIQQDVLNKTTHEKDTNFQVEIENQKVEGLITYSTEQQIFKFKVNSANNQKLWGVNVDSTSYELKWAINAILQHMVFILQQRIHVS